MIQDYKKPSLEQFRSSPSETEKYRHITAKYCDGCGVDVGSQGNPVVPWAISFDQTIEKCDAYTCGKRYTVHLRGDCRALPFESDSLDFVYSSHLIEDFVFSDWTPIIKEWVRCLKPGGNLIVLVPEITLWNNAIKAGQPPNCSHKYEPVLAMLQRLRFHAGLWSLKSG